ncbi:MAG: hypothetical protein NMK33_00175 [Candidatus Cardinium sp.]|uniref:hypothetical protein n=1 Tax=Cardinium endosymbiont of Dermatophagoides farinae TaxID=2597823 RepID=UPI001182DDCD|nr:hypothetical protein [Cardinium endosymbiont of Dermatophagoides farinae]TSJ80953.1 hypothetical protein FPG78_02855 [Cardinium endosymbiont of Dermatophagoides farinae]UWW96979.1 MAG: hypothetical protein NMK33_00175 [Candidatus Cardinium sp.]
MENLKICYKLREKDATLTRFDADQDQSVCKHIVVYKIKRPSSKPICDQQFLGEAQSSTGQILNVFEEHRQAPKLPFSNRFCRRSNEIERNQNI